jgi:ribosomal RNA-processing protein 17
VQNAALVEKAFGGYDHDNDDDWGGISESQHNSDHVADRFEDEEHLATVTVVEDFDPDTLIHGPLKPNPKPVPEYSHKHRRRDSSKSTGNIRYQTNAARKADRVMQRARRNEKAELACGSKSLVKKKR